MKMLTMLGLIAAVVLGGIAWLGIKKPKILGVIALCIVAAWMIAYPSGTWRYKMTLMVETPEGVKTGSAVREVAMSTNPRILPDAGTSHVEIKGEAIVVDLGQRGVMYALLRSDKSVDDGYMVFFKAFPQTEDVNSSAGVVRYYNGLKSGKADLMPDNLPMLVRFKDEADPKTVERVDPNNLAASFGEGVKLVGATIEITDEPITTGIEKRLPSWVGSGFNEWQRTLPYGHPLRMGWADFQTGVKK